MKRIIAVVALLAAVLVCGCAKPPSELSTEEAAKYVGTAVTDEYTYIEYGAHIAIDKYNAVKGDVVIPAVINGKPVTAVNKEAFADCPDITSVVIPEGVTTVGVRAFAGCEQLKSVTFPSSLKRVELAAFVFCRSLESATLPAGIEYIGDHSFRECAALTSVTVSSANLLFGESVFAFCPAKLRIHAPAGSTAEAYAEEYDIGFAVI